MGIPAAARATVDVVGGLPPAAHERLPGPGTDATGRLAAPSATPHRPPPGGSAAATPTPDSWFGRSATRSSREIPVSFQRRGAAWAFDRRRDGLGWDAMQSAFHRFLGRFRPSTRGLGEADNVVRGNYRRLWPGHPIGHSDRETGHRPAKLGCAKIQKYFWRDFWRGGNGSRRFSCIALSSSRSPRPAVVPFGRFVAGRRHLVLVPYVVVDAHTMPLHAPGMRTATQRGWPRRAAGRGARLPRPYGACRPGPESPRMLGFRGTSW